MKTHSQFSPLATPLAVAFSLLIVGGNLLAYGPGAPGNPGSVNPGVAVGSTGVGARGAAIGGSGSHGVSPSIVSGSRVAPAPVASSARTGVANFNNGAQLSSGHFATGAGVRITPPALPNQTLRSAPSTVSPNRVSPSGVNNLWSGTSPVLQNRARGTTGPVIGYHSQRPSVRNNGADNRPAGQYLNRGVYGSGLVNSNGNGLVNANGNRDGRRLHHRHLYYPYVGNGYYNYPYAYGAGYLPYLGGVTYPYLDAGGYYGVNTDSAASYYSNDPAVDNPDFTQPVPPATGQYQQQPNPDTARQGTVPNNGPDSLVEAVQAELSKRGYFGGKIDAMYGPDTKEALRRFQTDRHLAATGLINEATLHALQLD